MKTSAFTMRPLARAATAFAVAYAGTASALGLGEIDVSSYLYQRLNASVPVLTPTPEQRENLSVHLADVEVFRQAGIERSDYLSTLRFRLVDTPQGTRIVIESDQIVREPFLNLIVEAQWSNGRLLREYTVLFDPVPLAPKPVVAAALVPVPVPMVPPLPPQSTPAAIQTFALAQPKPLAPRRTAAAPLSYGPVRPHQAPRTIAALLYRRAHVTVEQVELALYRANLQAFEGGLLARLKPGAMLKIPALSNVTAVKPAAAKAAIEDLRERSGIFPAHRMQTTQPTLQRRPALPATAAPTPTPTPTPAMTEQVLPQSAQPVSQPVADAPSSLSEKPAAAPLAAAAAPPPLPFPVSLLWIGSAASMLAAIAAWCMLRLRRRRRAGGYPRGQHRDGLAERLSYSPANPALISPSEALPWPTVSGHDPEAAAPGGAARMAEDQFASTLPTPALERAGAMAEASPAPAVDVQQILSEAEFGLLYGQYDLAAALLADALQQLPGNDELQRKLAEVQFAAGAEQHQARAAVPQEQSVSELPLREDQACTSLPGAFPDLPSDAANAPLATAAGHHDSLGELKFLEGMVLAIPEVDLTQTRAEDASLTLSMQDLLLEDTTPAEPMNSAMNSSIETADEAPPRRHRRQAGLG